MGWVISGWVFLGISGRVGSARSQLFMPGLHHAHTLQHTQKTIMDAHPRESVLIIVRDHNSVSLHLLGQRSHFILR